MFLKKYFLFYLPRLDKFKIIKARNESEAVWKLCVNYCCREEDIENYKIIKNVDIIK